MKAIRSYERRKMSVALALTILRIIDMIDWYSEDGNIFLDLLGEPTGQGRGIA